MADNVLNLSTTEFDRPTITIDGDTFEMRAPEELSIKRVRRMSEIAESLKNTDDQDIDGVAAGVSDQLDMVMVDLPDDVKESLTLGQQAKILKAFTRLAKDDGAVASADSS